MINSYIKGTSYYVPEKIITNSDLEKLMDTTDEWITTRTGIKQRHSVGDQKLGPADLAVKSTIKRTSSRRIKFFSKHYYFKSYVR